MWSRSSRLSMESAGLNAPPQGMSSTTRRKASNSFRPQNSGTELAGPLSPPGATSTPATADRAERRSSAPRARASSPVMTLIIAGTVPVSSGNPLAVISTYSDRVAAGEAVGEGDGLGAAAAAASTATSEGMPRSMPEARAGGRLLPAVVAARPRMRSGQARQVLLPRFHRGQREPDGRALSGRALHADVPTVGADRLPRDEQPQARAARVRVGQAEELLE